MNIKSFAEICDSKLLRKENLDRALLVLYAAYIVISMTGNINLVQLSPDLVWLVTWASRLCCLLMTLPALGNLICGRYSKQNILVLAVAGVVLLATVFFSHNLSNLFLLIFLGAYCLIQFEDLCRYSFVVHLVSLALIVACSLLGVIDNASVGTSVRARECLGFDWATYSSNFLFYAILAWLAWRNIRASWAECTGLSLATIFFYLRTDTKSAFVLSLLAILVVAVMKLFPKLRRHSELYGIGTVALTVVCPVGIILYTVFGKSDSDMFGLFDALLSHRLQLGKLAMEKYGITLFGQPIRWIGGTAKEWMNKFPKSYNYVDSSFLQILLNYGVVLLILVIVYLIWIEVTAIRRKDTFILIAYAFLVVHTTFDPQLLLFSYHPLILGLAYINMRKGGDMP